MTEEKITRVPSSRRYIEFMKTLARTALLTLVAVAWAGCHETLTQLEPQLNTPAGQTAPGLAEALPGLAGLVAGDTLEITPPVIAQRLIAAAEDELAATEDRDQEPAPDDPGTGDGETDDLERARELIRWAKTALASGDHARAIQRGYYACRLLGVLPS